MEIRWSWDHWQRGVGCLGSQGSHLTARKPSWDGSRIGWDRGQFYQECLPSPPGGWIQLNISPRLVLDWAGTSKASLEFATQRQMIAWWLGCGDWPQLNAGARGQHLTNQLS